MKRRRTAVKRCEECDKSFESNEAGVRHFKSRSHTQKVLALKNALLMDEYEEIWEENDECFDENQQWESGDDDGLAYDDSQYLSEVELDEEMFSEEGAEEEPLFNMDEIVSDEADDAFFPFPSETFFLLYCYAHSIMRPKVRGYIGWIKRHEILECTKFFIEINCLHIACL